MSNIGPQQQLANERAAEQRAEETENDRKERIQKEFLFKKRMAMQKAFIPASKDQDSHGAFANATRNAEYSLEGVAGQMIAIIILEFLEFLFQTKYREHKYAFEQAKAAGRGGAYVPDANDNYPDIYPLGENGPDFTQAPVQNPSRLLILQNGYIPAADFKHALAEHFASYRANMLGTSSLSNDEKAFLSKSFDAAENKMKNDAKKAEDNPLLGGVFNRPGAQPAPPAPKPNFGH